MLWRRLLISRPFAVGTGNCGAGTQMIHFYNYNPNSNNLTSDVTLNCIPQLKVGNLGTGNWFSSSNASVSFNPADPEDLLYAYFFLPGTATHLCMELAGERPLPKQLG